MTLSASNTDLGETFRLVRLAEAVAKAGKDLHDQGIGLLLNHVVSLHDHKGDLTVTVRKAAPEKEIFMIELACKRAWEEVGESEEAVKLEREK